MSVRAASPVLAAHAAQAGRVAEPGSEAAASAIVVQGLSKVVEDASGPLTILNHIDLAVAQGDTLAIVGASGSGKSTLLSLLAGLDVPSSGDVMLCGRSLFGMSEDERAAHRAAHVGFVFQSFQLIGHLSALENVMLPLELRGQRDARQRATAMLERVGLGARLNHKPVLLSGGEQQRVALARAFVVRPDILMADEPTGSLDHATGQAIMDLMFELNREVGTTLVLVTHDAEIAQRCAHQVRIQAGQIAA
ncbi:MAG: ABC transporter ATP-binding protein [Proteobacteria bacterium]|nr:ABC transporter ATP-binding protein [Pseudomonadota bacterium]